MTRLQRFLLRDRNRCCSDSAWPSSPAATPVPSLIAVIVVWATGGAARRRMRLVLPGILLALFFIVFVCRHRSDRPVWYFTDQRPPPRGSGRRFTCTALSGIGGPDVAIVEQSAARHRRRGARTTARFRLPFALLPIAGSLVIVAIVVDRACGRAAPAAIVRVAAWSSPAALVVFCIIAMSFDMSDRSRVTRRSDCAFWLHLLAAPLIVHSLVSMVAPQLSQHHQRQPRSRSSRS